MPPIPEEAKRQARTAAQPPPIPLEARVPQAAPVQKASEATEGEKVGIFIPLPVYLDRFFHESEFIFTQSTLAAFLKGLFPEHKKRSRPEKLAQLRAALDVYAGTRGAEVEAVPLDPDMEEALKSLGYLE